MPGLQVSQSIDMAIHGLWALARLEEQQFVLLNELARIQNLSESYLAKVFQQLSRAGLVRAVRGKRGGYTLARPPATITVGDVVRALETDAPLYQCRTSWLWQTRQRRSWSIPAGLKPRPKNKNVPRGNCAR